MRNPFARTPKPQELASNARQIVGNLLILNDGRVLAGYEIGEVRWNFTDNDSKWSLITSSGNVWGSLALKGGRSFQERVTTLPHQVTSWARAYDENTPDPLPDVHYCNQDDFSADQLSAGECGCETWNKFLIRAQHRIARRGLENRLVFRYFEIGKVSSGLDVRSHVLSHAGSGVEVKNKEVAAVLAEESRITHIMAPWHPRRMSARQQAWLRMRALHPGRFPDAPQGWDGWNDDEIKALSTSTRWREEPLSRTLRVSTHHRGEVVEHAVQVISITRNGDTNYPESNREPWQVYVDHVTDDSGAYFPSEWAISGELHPGGDFLNDAELTLRRAQYLEKNYRDFDEIPPVQVADGIERSLIIRDNLMKEDDLGPSVQFRGTIDIIVHADDVVTPEGEVVRTAEDVVTMRANSIMQFYSSPSMKFDCTVLESPWYRLQATIPGERRDRIAAQRQMSAIYLACGMPTASSAVGDNIGSYIASTRGSSQRAVMHDSHYATEGQGEKGRKQNMWIIAGSLGSGKSTLAGLISYQNARRGITTALDDPSGPLLRLCDLPELKPFSLGIDTRRSPGGILNPPSLVTEPRHEDFRTPEDFNRARVRAAAERRALAVDYARRCLDFDLFANPKTTPALRAASRKVAWTQRSTMWDLVRALESLGDLLADQIASGLKEASQTMHLALAFAEDEGEASIDYIGSDKRLIVTATPGIKRAPDESPRSDWSSDEQGADVVLGLSSHWTARIVYDKPMKSRACAVFDEAENMLSNTPGRSLLARLGRDHSKWNTALYLSMKSINDQMLSGEMRNFVAGTFVGRMPSRSAAEDMLAVLNLTDRRYAASLMSLSEFRPGEFVCLDFDGRVGGIDVDVWIPHLAEALNTNPAKGTQHWGTLLESSLR